MAENVEVEFINVETYHPKADSIIVITAKDFGIELESIKYKIGG